MHKNETQAFPLLIQEGCLRPQLCQLAQSLCGDGVVESSVISALCPILWGSDSQ